MEQDELLDQLDRLNTIGIALSSEPDSKRLLETILLAAQELTNADGGTLYTVTDEQTLKFEIMRTNSLNISIGGTTGKPVPFPPLPLYLRDKRPNINMVAATSVLIDQTINIEDAYVTDTFDFSGTREFDEKMTYRSKSFLTVPMKNHEGEIIGVLQLINAIDRDTKEFVAFSQPHERLVESLASQAAVAMTNQNLIGGLKDLFESFIKLIADAIDEKSPYTGEHCQRVPELTMMLAEKAMKSKDGPFKDFSMTEKEVYELKIAAWLHDCGKVTTPGHIMDKSTKLESVFDRVHLIDQRFELLKYQRESAYFRMMLEAAQGGKPLNEVSLKKEIKRIFAQLEKDKKFIRKVNIGGESMSSQDQSRILKIANYEFISESGDVVKFLTDNEVYNLTVPRGTLTPEERSIINNHISVTIRMLESLPYPKGLERVPEYAGAHHERMDGKGYPRGLVREQMSIPARMMGIADVFEALTAGDRPYKNAKTLSETLEILGKMKEDNHIDPDIFDLFVREKVYMQYAKMFLEPSQIDHVDESKIPGYSAEKPAH